MARAAISPRYALGGLGADGAAGAAGAGGAAGAAGAVGAGASPKPSSDVLQNGHFFGSTPFVKFTFLPQFGHSTAAFASAGLKHMRVSPFFTFRCSMHEHRAIECRTMPRLALKSGLPWRSKGTRRQRGVTCSDLPRFRSLFPFRNSLRLDLFGKLCTAFHACGQNEEIPLSANGAVHILRPAVIAG